MGPRGPRGQNPAVQRRLGRYEILGVLGHGGMATVYLGRADGEPGFRRLVAIKVLHPHLSEDASFVGMLLDEARIAARLHHPNVVPIVDLQTERGLHYVVMEYVEGCAMFELLAKNREHRPPELIVPIVLDALAGLHAAHELRGDDGESLELVHRDVSPQNVLVGVEGVARITDFGVARAAARITTTRPERRGAKGRVGFLSPEQLRGEAIDRRADVFAAGVLLWTALTGTRLFYDPDSEAATATRTLTMKVPPPSTLGLKPPAAFDAVCLRALERDPSARFETALSMEEALRSAALEAGMLGTRREVADWMRRTFGDELSARRVGGSRATPADDETPPTTAAIAPAPRARKRLIAGVLGAAAVVALAVAANEHAPSTIAASLRTAPLETVVSAPKAIELPLPSAAPTPPITVAPPPSATAVAPRRMPRVHKTPAPPPSASAPPRWDSDSPFPPP